ncbi:YhcH/YjgK/YiaL family protein [Pseudovibrio sp. Tun.PSC04-5.I4]|uniref:YhcH/YjgK/YiaL family protein n=1 Tax=Pseudovibrio sp. Tun.PSC04-5.I4 TaxID=1798213 RepID=UPI00088B727A|nr:YhcH/YjgK/YiaL family protein [Pseudovibrio sp. Tun.PSC04-5.I4]SDR48560.1 biofilm protein TabA [Pseudovibrio sp. Tun.PSC04-5.I4]
MLSANLENLDIVPYIQPKLMDIIVRAKAFLAEGPDLGRYTLEGDDLFIQVVEGETEAAEKRPSEFHNFYMDIQVLLAGHEVIGWGHKPHNAVTNDMLAEKDLAFTDGIAEEKFIELMPFDFAIFYPGELHRPLCVAPTGPTKCRKAVVKVHRKLLEA